MPTAEVPQPLLIHAGAMLSGAGSEADRDVVIATLGDRIAAIGVTSEVSDRDGKARRLGGPSSIVLPGFINAHHHTGLTPLQLGAPYLPLELWLPRFIGFRAVDPYLDTLHSGIEMLRSGVTTVQHIHGGPAGPRSGWRTTAERIITAYRHLGMRVSYCFMARDQNRLTYDDAEFLPRLPPALRDEVEALLAARSPSIEAQIDFFEELAEAYNRPGSAVRIQLAPANLHWCSDRALGLLRDAARRHGVGMHMHLLETPYQAAYAHRRSGRSAVRHLADLGLLGPEMTLGHGIWMTEADIDLVAATGTCLCHNPSSGIRLRSGIAPVAAARRRGVRVALGIDQAGLNDDRDMLLEMRMAWALQRSAGHGPEPLEAAAVLAMATADGAATTPYAQDIGVLAPGRAADVVLLDAEQIAAPYLDSATPLVEAFLHRAKPASVRTVVIGGEVVLEDGRPTRVDPADVGAALAASLARPPTEDERKRRALADALGRHVAEFYKDWPTPEGGTGFLTFNSRFEAVQRQP